MILICYESVKRCLLSFVYTQNTRCPLQLACDLVSWLFGKWLVFLLRCLWQWQWHKRAYTMTATRYTMTATAVKTWKTNGIHRQSHSEFTVIPSFRKHVCGRHCLWPSLSNPHKMLIIMCFRWAILSAWPTERRRSLWKMTRLITEPKLYTV